MIKTTRWSRKGQYVVIGKGVPRSVGLNLKSSALKYAKFYKEKGKKPKIYLLK